MLGSVLQFADQIHKRRIVNIRFEIEEETEFKFTAGDGAAFQFGQVDSSQREAGNDIIECAGSVGKIEHDGYLPGIGIALHVPGNADEACEIVLHIADVVLLNL